MILRTQRVLYKMSNHRPLIHPHTHLTFDDVLLLPNYSEIMPSETDLETELCKGVVLEIPILSAPMDTVTEAPMLIALGRQGGLGVLHRNLAISDQVQQLKRALDLHLKAAAAVGVGEDFTERVEKLAECQPTALCIDSAHGYTKNMIEATRAVKQAFPRIPLIAGNVATYEGAKALFEAGADVVKVGMGAGSICTTRIMSGMGVPQFSALIEVKRAAVECGKEMIADGGIRTSGDIVKALAAGASAVMLGSLLAGTEASPGDLVEIDQKCYKQYRGMGSVKSMLKGSAARYGQISGTDQVKKLVPQGVEGLIEYTGSLEEHLHQLLGGVRAGLAYLGATTINQLQKCARFIPISHAGMTESHPHTICTR
jgi:IMP dehydrogenase